MTTTIPYEPGTFAGEFSHDEMKEFETYIARQAPAFQFDLAYVEHISTYHGGVPVNKFLTTLVGKEQRIDRFLNFRDTSADQNQKLNAYNANVVWSNIEDRLSLYLVPFVDLSGGNKLCFDISDPTNHRVVCWFHELSEGDLPYTEVVSDSFVDFLKLLC